MKRSKGALVSLAVAALLLAACGSDDNSSDGTTAATGAATTAGSAATAARRRRPAATTSGGTGGGTATTGAPQKADDSKSPVLVGFHNLEGGADLAAGDPRGLRVRHQLRQRGARRDQRPPDEADSCKLDLTPESSVNCANQFVEKNVVMAVQGVDVAADAALPVLKQAGIVEFGFFAFTPGHEHGRGRRLLHAVLEGGGPRRRPDDPAELGRQEGRRRPGRPADGARRTRRR